MGNYKKGGEYKPRIVFEVTEELFFRFMHIPKGYRKLVFTELAKQVIEAWDVGGEAALAAIVNGSVRLTVKGEGYGSTGRVQEKPDKDVTGGVARGDYEDTFQPAEAHGIDGEEEQEEEGEGDGGTCDPTFGDA